MRATDVAYMIEETISAGQFGRGSAWLLDSLNTMAESGQPVMGGSGTATIGLQVGETIKLDLIPSAFWTWPYYLFTLGLWSVWRSRQHFVVTNQRVFVLKGIVSKREVAVPLNRIEASSAKKWCRLSPGGRVVLASADRCLRSPVIGPLTSKDARFFADAVTEQVRLIRLQSNPRLHPN